MSSLQPNSSYPTPIPGPSPERHAAHGSSQESALTGTVLLLPDSSENVDLENKKCRVSYKLKTKNLSPLYQPSDSLIWEDLPIFSTQRVRCGCLTWYPAAYGDSFVGPWTVHAFCDFGLWVLCWVKLEMLTAIVSHAEWIFWITDLTKLMLIKSGILCVCCF